MKRGTTQYITYTDLNFNALEASNWSITLQGECAEVKKVKGDEFYIDESNITVKLTPEELLKFNDEEVVKVQLKAEVNGDTGATDIEARPIEEILDEVPFTKVVE